MYMFKSSGSTERVNSSQTSKQIQIVDAKFKKEFMKQKQSNRDFVNRSAIAGSSTDMPIKPASVPLGKSPDRGKSKTVYSHGHSNS